jgi:hypothetical protein
MESSLFMSGEACVGGGKSHGRGLDLWGTENPYQVRNSAADKKKGEQLPIKEISWGVSPLFFGNYCTFAHDWGG